MNSRALFNLHTFRLFSVTTAVTRGFTNGTLPRELNFRIKCCNSGLNLSVYHISSKLAQLVRRNSTTNIQPSSSLFSLLYYFEIIGKLGFLGILRKVQRFQTLFHTYVHLSCKYPWYFLLGLMQSTKVTSNMFSEQ